jgi:hypothetical protein
MIKPPYVLEMEVEMLRSRFVAEAEQYALARLALSGQPERARYHAQALSWLGKSMITAGRYLQTHYSAHADSMKEAAFDYQTPR